MRVGGLQSAHLPCNLGALGSPAGGTSASVAATSTSWQTLIRRSCMARSWLTPDPARSLTQCRRGSVLRRGATARRAGPTPRGMTDSARIALLHEVLSVTFDSDDGGNALVLGQTPGCPRCGSRSIEPFTETDEPVADQPVPVLARDYFDWSLFAPSARRRTRAPTT